MGAKVQQGGNHLIVFIHEFDAGQSMVTVGGIGRAFHPETKAGLQVTVYIAVAFDLAIAPLGRTQAVHSLTDCFQTLFQFDLQEQFQLLFVTGELATIAGGGMVMGHAEDHVLLADAPEGTQLFFRSASS